MSFVYTAAKAELVKGNLDFDGQDYRLLLVMSNTTADTEQDAKFVDDLTTLDEYDGSGYIRKALASEAVAQDDANNRGEFTADPVTWSSLGVGTRQAVAAVLIRHVTDDTDSILIAYIDSGGFPWDGNGGDVTWTPNAQGILQAS